jgi:large subunit ribosomal protein L29
MKKKDFMKEIRGMDVSSLEMKATSLAEELMRLRFKAATRQLEKAHQLKTVRRSLARVQTVLEAKRHVASADVIKG